MFEVKGNGGLVLGEEIAGWGRGGGDGEVDAEDGGAKGGQEEAAVWY